MSSDERRTDTRIHVRVPIRFRVLNDPDLPEQMAAVENISRRGFYFETEFPLVVGTLLDVSMRMPRELASQTVSDIRCLARVVHVRPGSFSRGKSGIGMHIERYERAAGKEPMMVTDKAARHKERVAS